METPDYPPNSFKSKEQPQTPQEDKKINRVTSSEPIRRRKPLGKQFKKLFFGGDAKTAGQHVIFSVLIPAAQDMFLDGINDMAERMVKGESRRRRNPPASGPSGYVSYNRYAMGQPPQQQTQPRYLTQRARSQHNFDEIILTSRAEAEEVIERMFDIISRYESVTVSDFYELVGVPSAHTDHKWGWTDIRGAGVARVRNGYLLDLPEPEPLG